MYWQPGTVGEWLDGDGTSYTPKELTGSQHVYIEPVQPPRTHADLDETRAIAGRLYDKVLELQAEVAALREAQTRAAGEIERLRAIIASEVSWYEEEHQRGNLTPEGQSARSVWRQMQTEMTMRRDTVDG